MLASVAQVPIDLTALYETGDPGLVEMHKQVVHRALEVRADAARKAQGG